MSRIVEILTLNLKSGTRAQFHQLYKDEALPLLRRWGHDVIAFGPSPHDEDSYYVIRVYQDLADRQRSQDEYCGSDDWRQGPRERVLAMIEHLATAVLEVDEATIQGLRR